MTGTTKLVITAAMFAIALGMVALAAATKVTAPLFAAWAPLLVVPYVLTRREPGEPGTSSTETQTEAGPEDLEEQPPAS